MLTASIIGNIGGDPEQRYSPSGTASLRFNVACNGRVKDQSGNWVDETTWVRVMVFGARAETLSNYLKKGTRVYVSGRLEARPWTDQQGNVRAGLEVMANEVQFMSARQQDEGERPAPVQQARRPAAASDGMSDLPF